MEKNFAVAQATFYFSFQRIRYLITLIRRDESTFSGHFYDSFRDVMLSGMHEGNIELFTYSYNYVQIQCL